MLTTITPICNAFGIKDFDYIITEEKERLIINHTEIGCSGNSVSAVVDELIGYIFVVRWCRNRSLGAFEKQTLNVIQRHWIKDNGGFGG